MNIRVLFPTVIIIVTLALPAFAQVDRASLNGTVTDATGAVVGGALVEVSSPLTGFKRAVRTSDGGTYSLPAVPTGLYVLSATKDGFQTAVVPEVRLGVGETRTLDFQLEVGGVSEQVVVEAAVTPLQQTGAEIGSAVTGTQLEDIPLNGRNWASLMALAPGAVNTGEGNQGNIRFFGRARDDNNWTFDGVDATGIKDPRQEASLRLVMSTEAIAEFRVSSTGYNAESGTGAGAQVNLVSKSGSNQFRSGVFTYFRDDALDSRRVLDTLPEEPPFRLYQYGFSSGGPIVRNRTFFFGAYEGLRQTLGVANQTPALVPSAAFRERTLAAQPALAPIINAYPLGTAPTSNPDIDQYSGRRELSWDEDSFLARVDHRFSDRTQFITRINGVKGVIDSEVRSDLLETRRSDSFPMNFTAQVQQVFSPTLLGEVKFGWNRSPLYRVDQGLGAESYEIQRAFTPTRATVVNEERPESFSYLGNVTVARPSATWKFGGEFRQVHVDVANGPGASVRWGSTNDFLANRTNRIRIDGELPLQEGRRWYGIAYGQTEWRLTPALTANLGLRYEYYSVMQEASGRGAVLDLEQCPPTAASLFCPEGTSWYEGDTNNLGPRLGLAWTLDDRTVLRGGYGIYYSTGQNDDVMAAIDSLATRGDLTTPASYPIEPYVPLALARANQRPRALQRDRDDMQAQIFSASVQREFAGRWVAQAAYVGSRGTNVFNRLFINTIDPVTGQRPAAPYLTTQIDRKGNLGETEYDGLLLSVQRNFRDGLLLQANYTLGEARDNNAGNGEGSEWQDARCRDCEWGPSDFDVRHNFVLNAVYELPFGGGRRYLTDGAASAILGGWNVSTVLMAKSGRPVNVLITRTAPDGNDVNQRPNLVPGVEAVPGGEPTGWLNVAAFAAPAANEFGNAPRNGFRGPGAWQLDLSLTKRIRVAADSSIEFRIDGFNVFNIDQYGNPNRLVSTPLTFGALTPLNSQPTGTGTARQFQLGVRVEF